MTVFNVLMKIVITIMRLHICRRSGDQSSIGPIAVEAQSTESANCICGGRLSEIGRRVQSKKPISFAESDLAKLSLSTPAAVAALNTASLAEEGEYLGRRLSTVDICATALSYDVDSTSERLTFFALLLVAVTGVCAGSLGDNSTDGGITAPK